MKMMQMRVIQWYNGCFYRCFCSRRGNQRNWAAYWTLCRVSSQSDIVIAENHSVNRWMQVILITSIVVVKHRHCNSLSSVCGVFRGSHHVYPYLF